MANSMRYLKWLAHEGIEHRAKDLSLPHHERLNYELDIIETLDYPDYFLTLHEIVHYAKSAGISVGPARGSAGGCQTAFALGITELDALEHGLMMERFLNPARVSMPDIDLDVNDAQRSELLEWIIDRWGDDHVAVIGTYGTIGARAAIHDAGRVLGYSRTVTNEIVGYLPPAIFGRSPGLDELVVPNDYYLDILELAYGLEGLIRSASQHAAGVVISPDPLPDLIPLWRQGGKGGNVTAFDMHEIESQGFIKIDVLGLRTLGVIDHALSML